jgi:flagellar hook-associated protein 3 FlgL
MRVSERYIYDSGRQRLEVRREALARATEQASSGLRVSRAKDDPRAAALLVRHEGVRARADSISATAGSALDDLDAVDGALGEASSTLEQAVSLAVQLSNDTFNASDRAGGAQSASQLLKAFVGALNIESDGRFLLSGTRDDTPPFTDAGVYQGDDGVRSLELAPGIVEQVSVRADLGVAGTGGGTDIPAAIIALRDALAANDTNAIRASIGGLNDSVRQLATLRTDVGARAVSVQSARSVAFGVKDAAVRATATEGEVDIASAATSLAQAERAFEAATQATARSFRLTLLDSLR